jgi:lipid-binding SYLF domain-containing protein
MRKAAFVAFVLMGVLAMASCSRTPSLHDQAQELVDKARWTLETFKGRHDPQSDTFRSLLSKAEGVVVFPGAYKAGFILGAEYGTGVMLAKQPSGAWSQPAFYTMGAGSLGLQIGGQVSETVLIVRSQKAVQAIVKHQGKMGADIEVTVGTIGSGMEGATTTNMRADVVVFSSSAGLYAGGSFEGSVLARRNDMNEAYYGPGATPDTILFGQNFSNPQSDALRQAVNVR